MRNKAAIFLVFVFFCLRSSAGFLDKKYYLVDSLEENKIAANDRAALDRRLKEYHLQNSDTSRFKVLKLIVEDIVDEKVWTKYNRLLLKWSKEKQEGAGGRSFFLYKTGEALALNNIGYYYYNFTDNYNKALEYYQEGLKINESLQNYDGMVESWSNIANLYQNNGDLMKALDSYQKALGLETKVKNKQTFVAPLNNIAQVYLYLNDTANALLHLKKCLLMISGSGDKSMRAHILHNIGVISVEHDLSDSSGLRNMYEALALREEIGEKKGIIQSCLSLATGSKKMGYLDKARYFLKKAEAALKTVDAPNLEALYYNNLGQVLSATDRQAAIPPLEKAAEIYRKLGTGVELVETYEALVSLYGNKPEYAAKKLKIYEDLNDLNERINKSNLQKLMLQQKYDDQMQMRNAMFTAEEKIREEKNSSDKRKREWMTAGILCILLITLVYSFFLFKAFKQIKTNNRVISEQKLEVEKQKHLVEEKHKDITDSINYAQRIQSALIIGEENLKKNLKEVFVLFKPRDIVSGDFYWYGEHGGKKIVVVADCTGHGVPGAFMSMIGITLLNQIVNEKGIISPARILAEMRKEVIRALSADAAGKQDGMDMAIVVFDENELKFAGANSKALLMLNDNITELLPNKQPIGFYEKAEEFSEQPVKIEPGMKLFLYSDGITDQFGGKPGESAGRWDGEKSTLFGKKLKIKQFKSWLLSTSGLTLSAQKKAIEENLENWKRDFEQTDDITLIGIKLA